MRRTLSANGVLAVLLMGLAINVGWNGTASATTWPTHLAGRLLTHRQSSMPFGSSIARGHLLSGWMGSKNYQGKYGFALADIGIYEYPVSTVDHGQQWRIAGDFFNLDDTSGMGAGDSPSNIVTLSPNVAVAYRRGDITGPVSAIFVTVDSGRKWYITYAPGSVTSISSLVANRNPSDLRVLVATVSSLQSPGKDRTYTTLNHGLSWSLATTTSDHAAERAVRAKSATTVLQPGTIVGHRFVKTFILSDGALTLTPWSGTTPHLSYAEETVLWATDGLSGTVQGVGFADVTLNRSLTKVQSGPRIGSLVDTPSLVELTKSEDIAYSCTAEIAGRGTTVVPVSQGWYAVILPLAANKSDVLFSAASNVCQQLTPNTVSAAYEDVSIPWHLATHPTTGTVIVALLPKCGHVIMSGGGGNEFTRKFEYQVEAAILDKAPGTVCSPATEVDEGQNYASPSTTHGFVGPWLNVGPHAGDVMTSIGPKTQPLQ